MVSKARFIGTIKRKRDEDGGRLRTNIYSSSRLILSAKVKGIEKLAASCPSHDRSLNTILKTTCYRSFFREFLYRLYRDKVAYLEATIGSPEVMLIWGKKRVGICPPIDPDITKESTYREAVTGFGPI